MKTTIRSLFYLAVLLGLVSALSAIPPGTGSKHIRITGYEVVLAPPQAAAEPGWLLLQTKHTLLAKNLGGEVIELFMELTYKEVPAPDGSFTMFGSGPIQDEGGDVIGSASFMNKGMYLAPPPWLEWVADGTLVGTIWAGPYAGMVLTENVSIDARINVFTGEADWYESLVDGFLIASDNVE